jgi:hypothetical protein
LLRDLGVSEAVVRAFVASSGIGESSPKPVDEIARESALKGGREEKNIR